MYYKKIKFERSAFSKQPYSTRSIFQQDKELFTLIKNFNFKSVLNFTSFSDIFFQD